MNQTTSYEDFFQRATGNKPYPFQSRLARDEWPDLLDIPTGLGKTAAVTLAWLYRRRELGDTAMPRRLVWCLPMRVLVEQTTSNIDGWLDRLDLRGQPGDDRVSVHVLMGGEPRLRQATWAHHPEEDAILIGTQDMLLSRALMRGYGMSRYQWPVHFALFHSDALWVFDEVQLMGSALSTSAQLEAFRRRRSEPHAARSLWVSATLDTQSLATIDFRPAIPDLRNQRLGDDDRALGAVRKRLQASKSVRRAATRLDAENCKAKAAAYIHALAGEVLERHVPGEQTLVILNRVDRAQSLYAALAKQKTGIDLLLLHARFRLRERSAIEQALYRPAGDSGRIIVATQAIEAGVDLSSHTMFTELAPWTSMVQRFGRCNRDGMHEQAEIRWIDIEADADEAIPYTQDQLEESRSLLDQLHSASPGDLPAARPSLPGVHVLRWRDLAALFNTDPDLSGFDVDISPYIRDAGSPQVQIFWRDFADRPENTIAPAREELCPAGLGQVRALLGGKAAQAWTWNGLDGRWDKVTKAGVRPGMILLVHCGHGGYDIQKGFDAGSKKPVSPIDQAVDAVAESQGDDPWTLIGREVGLPRHLKDVAEEVSVLATRLSIDTDTQSALATAARWHDTGKAHEAFQRGIQTNYIPGESPILAKSGGSARPDYHVMDETGKRTRRPGFRHELASMLAWLEHGEDSGSKDLIAYLICAHHGRVRMGLRALPNESEPPEPGRLFARGVWHDDILTSVQMNGTSLPRTRLKLDVMQLGRGPGGASWTERTQRLLDRHGPFELAWLEALVRIADWRASRAEAADSNGGGEP